ncbi:restriction endonuclease subunit S [Dechloromonas denitrificans]|nr:restriction endonuclease subunit S [Dechloromonas denitrificans]
MSGLPSGWAATNIAEIGDLVGGKTPSKAEPRFWANGTVTWVSPKDMKVFDLAGSEDQISETAISDGGMNLLPAQSILMVTRSGILSHTFPVAITRNPVTINQDIKAITPTAAFNTRYLAYNLKSQQRAILNGCAKSGTTVESIETEQLKRLPIPLAPLPEQKRIADKLDNVLARVDACRDRLDRLPALLKRFRQSILAAATSGRLTEDWREKQAIDNWGSDISFGELGKVSGGLTKNGKRSELQLQKPYLRVANVYANELRLEDVASIGMTQQEFSKTCLQRDDLLIVEGNGSIDQVGRVAIWSAEVPDCSHQNHLIRWRAGPRLLPKFALYFLLSPEGRSQIIDVASSTTGLHTLSISKVSGMSVPVPSLPEQTEIIRRVEILFAFADRLEARLTTARRQVGQLTPALLAKAFRGELVPQDPADEPAAELLKRLAAQRETAPKTNRGRKIASR